MGNVKVNSQVFLQLVETIPIKVISEILFLNFIVQYVLLLILTL